jgi:acyl-CoA synthetase (AMP-forming)/AMP-acid ligase II
VPDKIPLEVVLDRNELSAGNVVMASDESTNRVCVSSGKLIEGCKVKIVDPDRKQVGENKVGEIAVISVSLFDGYRNYPEKTAEALDENGWYYTGDYGFMHNDELFVIGRKKDIIIEAGNNIYPEDVEDAVNKVNGVLPGRVIAFGEEDEELGTEHVSVVAETNESEENFRKLKMDIIRAGMSINVNIKTVYLVPSRWLIKSSAGKPSRKANRNRIINKEFEQVWS